MVAAAWLRFSAIDRTDALRVWCICVVCVSVCVRVRVCACGMKRVRAKWFGGKKCSRRVRQSGGGRGSNGIRKFNPSVCGFFAIGGRPCRICRRINNRICGWHVRQELYHIAYRLSTALSPITLCKILVYISFNVNFLRHDVRNLNIQ